MRELILSSGPARYLGGSIETFALPMGAFIVIALVLFYLYRRPHSVPRLRYLRPAHQTALGTREPGTEGPVVYVAPATVAPPAAGPAGTKAPAGPEAATAEPAGAGTGEGSDSGSDGTSAEGETF